MSGRLGTRHKRYRNRNFARAGGGSRQIFLRKPEWARFAEKWAIVLCGFVGIVIGAFAGSGFIGAMIGAAVGWLVVAAAYWKTRGNRL